jgi:hypothetical protein
MKTEYGPTFADLDQWDTATALQNLHASQIAAVAAVRYRRISKGGGCNRRPAPARAADDLCKRQHQRHYHTGANWLARGAASAAAAPVDAEDDHQAAGFG